MRLGSARRCDNTEPHAAYDQDLSSTYKDRNGEWSTNQQWRSLGRAIAAVVLVVLALGQRLDPLPAAMPNAVSGWNASAQEAPPETTASNAACDVAPRPFAELAALASSPPGIFSAGLAGTPVATPAPPFVGTPADQATIEAVTATVAEQVDCMNAGDLLRVAALWSDQFLQRAIGGLDESDYAQLATPTPLLERERMTLRSVEDVRLLEDGRVSAVTQVDDGLALVLFVEFDGRYLIDESYVSVQEGTPVP